MEANNHNANGENKMTNYNVIRPEMNEAIPATTTVTGRVARGGFVLKTDKVLKGRGIKNDGPDNNGKNCYLVTQNAFERICKTEVVTLISLLS